MTKIGVLHPGEMGISLAASAINSGHQVYWLPQDRSDQSRARAAKHQLVDTDSLDQLCQICDVIISICPPHAAAAIARSVLEHGFAGYYLDANAISPQRARSIGQMMADHGLRFIDGGIIGGPAWTPKETWLYLSGKDAQVITNCFANGPLETQIIGDEIGRASALKICYAAYSKGTTAVLAAILATAESLGVRAELYQHWDRDNAGFSEQTNQRVTRVTAKAWRFEGEMHEIASAFQEAGLPNGFQAAAAEIYHRMARFKDAAETPQLDDILQVLIQK